MASLIPHIHTHIRAARLTREGAGGRPEDAPRGSHKEYPRMPRIALPEPAELAVPLAEAIRNRSSFNRAVTDRPFSLQEMGTLLGLALRARSGHSRNYPSGGALFPVETYVLGNVLAGQPPSVYHYHPSAHALEHLWELPNDFSMSKVIRSSGTPLAGTLVVFTALWERSAKKYGDLAYSHALVEAGHMAQNITLAASAMQVQNRPVAGCHDAYTSELLDLERDREQFVHGLLISAKSSAA